MQAYGGPFAFYCLYSSGLDPLPCTTQRGTKSFKIQPDVSPLEKGKGCPAPTSEKDLTVSLNQIFKSLAPPSPGTSPRPMYPHLNLPKLL